MLSLWGIISAITSSIKAIFNIWITRNTTYLSTPYVPCILCFPTSGVKAQTILQCFTLVILSPLRP